MIIFDLDDTLIDTSGCVTPFKMRQCLQKMVSFRDFEEAYQELLGINQDSLSSQEAFQKFLAKRGLDAGLLKVALDEMTTPLPAFFEISTTPNAKEILQIFKKSHILALVTGGHPSFQLEKLEKAGIDRSFFSKIAIPEDSIKKPFYEGLMKEFSMRPQEVLVCGDRIAMDLAPAFELGCTTVHMRWGRGRVIKTDSWVHYSIQDLSELKRIIKL